MFFGKKKQKSDPAPSAEAARPAAPAAPPAAPAAAPNATPTAAAVTSTAGESGTQKHPLRALGEVVSLMLTSPTYKSASMADISELVMPALKHNQVAIAEAHDDKGVRRPVAAVLWARVSADVDRRLISTGQFPPRLTANEWNSGDIPWVVMAVGSGRACEATIGQIAKVQLGGAHIKVPTRSESGAVTVKEMALTH